MYRHSSPSISGASWELAWRAIQTSSRGTKSLRTWGRRLKRTCYTFGMLSQIHRWLPLKSRTSIPRRAYTCLCILGVPRSGSNLLRGLLNDHPDILVHNEVFCAIAPVRETSLLWEKRPRVPYQKGHIAPYLEEHVFPKDPEGKKVIGFKLFPSHIDYLERGEREWEAIRGIPDLRVLLLRRENYLDIALSAELANRSMQWISTGQSPPEPAPMVLPSTCSSGISIPWRSTTARSKSGRGVSMCSP